jgi:hypothetical protein
MDILPFNAATDIQEGTPPLKTRHMGPRKEFVRLHEISSWPTCRNFLYTHLQLPAQLTAVTDTAVTLPHLDPHLHHTTDYRASHDTVGLGVSYYHNHHLRTSIVNTSRSITLLYTKYLDTAAYWSVSAQNLTIDSLQS